MFIFCLRSWLLLSLGLICIRNIGISVCDECVSPNCTTGVQYLQSACPHGSTEYTCDTNCDSNCDGISCVLRDGSEECMNGCKDGYSGRACSIPCIHNCLKCKQDNRENCIQCSIDHYGSKCEFPCSRGCGQSGCYDNGVCKEKCSPSKVCGNKCLNRCKLCNLTEGVCEICQTDYTGNDCEVSCQHCISHRGICPKSGCLGCSKGFYGKFCVMQCPYYCHSSCSQSKNCKSECEQISGKCLSGCKPGYWGENCTAICENCKKNFCDFVTGKCIDCKEGLYGIYCNLPCDNCPAGVCGRSDGNCIETTTLQYTTHTRRELLIERPVTIAFISFGTLSVIVISLLIYKLCWRSSSETRDVKTKFRCDATTVYFSSAYDDINEEDMDRSLVQSYSSTETGEEIQFREDSETSSENDSLIIPQWLWHMENKGQSSNLQPKDGRYLLPVKYEKNY